MIKCLCRNIAYEITAYESVNATTNALVDIAKGYLLDHGYDSLGTIEPTMMRPHIANAKLFYRSSGNDDLTIKVGVFWGTKIDSDRHYYLSMEVKIYGCAYVLNGADENQCDDALKLFDKEICDVADALANQWRANGIAIKDEGTQKFIADNIDSTWDGLKNNALYMYSN